MSTTRTRIASGATLEISAPVADLSRELKRVGIADVLDTSKLVRALYSSDASIYRVTPQAVAHPRSIDELVAVLDAARLVEMPVTTRGAGTSCAGNAVGPGLIVDVSRHLNQVHEIDPDASVAIVDPGLVQAKLQQAAAPFGLRFGPDPSSHTRCTIGGMIGNNACGPRALGYGKTADNVVALDVVTGHGERLTVDSRDPAMSASSPTLAQLQRLVSENLALVRTEFGTFDRQVSGYSLEQLLPENRFNAARFLAGTEGTLAVITRATVRLVGDAPHKLMIALGYPSMAAAADDTPSLLTFSPTAVEGLDRRIVEVVRRTHGESSVPELPRGDGWLFVELVGVEPGEVAARARKLVAASDALATRIVADPAQAQALWKIRADGAGLAEVSLANPAYPGWEDAAVPPAALGSYLREFEALMLQHGLHGLPYGHFGVGCVHIRIDYPLSAPDGPQRYREFITAAAELVAGYGGSMSGEHGDGRARSELLPIMYSPAAIKLFGQVKAAFDPENRLNPGVLVDPAPLSANIRRSALAGRALDHFGREVHRCSGVGKCLADSTSGGGVMCPSYQATRDEKDSTRGRARVLQEMVNGDLVGSGWRSPEVHAALDLCLSCKGCARDCPTGIDMAAYKSEVLDHTYAGRLRPRSHYALGWLPRWARLITRTPALSRLVNLTTSLPGLRGLVKWSAGVDQRRQLPKFATRPATRRLQPQLAATATDVGHARDQAAKPAANSTKVAGSKKVLIWVDSFSDCFVGAGAEATVRVLQAAGYAPEFLDRAACCGLTWISTGQRDAARRQLRASVDLLHPYVAAGVPVVGLEPSCTAVWRSDALELLPDDPRVVELAAGIHTLAELLTQTSGWNPPDLTGVEIVAQPHCHHASVLGWHADSALLQRTGAKVTTLGGCCGLAGNFGVEQGHYDVSVQVAKHDLLPAITSHPDALVLADGFSCRTQVAELAGKQAITLAELLVIRTHR